MTLSRRAFLALSGATLLAAALPDGLLHADSAVSDGGQ